MAVPAPGMAADDAFEGQPAAFDCAVFAHRFQSILRAGRGIAAARGNQRADSIAVKLNQTQYQFGEHDVYGFFSNSCASWRRISGASARSKRRLTRTIKSCGGIFVLWQRNHSRITRFI